MKVVSVIDGGGNAFLLDTLLILDPDNVTDLLKFREWEKKQVRNENSIVTSESFLVMTEGHLQSYEEYLEETGQPPVCRDYYRLRREVAAWGKEFSIQDAVEFCREKKYTKEEVVQEMMEQGHDRVLVVTLLGAWALEELEENDND